MKRNLFIIILLSLMPFIEIAAQKKEMNQAKTNIKEGKQLAETEASLRGLLVDPTNRTNEKIWFLLFDAVKKQYEVCNEKMYLKQAVDTTHFFNSIYRMFGVLESIDSLDAQPDDKGRVKLKYRKRNSEYLHPLRANLFNGGLYFMGKKNYSHAFDLFSTYIDCYKQPLFEHYNYAQSDKRLSEAAFYAMHVAYMSNDVNKTLHYAPLAQEDTARLDLVYNYMAESYVQIADTTNYLDVLQSGFAKYPLYDYFFTHLFDYYFKHGNNDVALALCHDVVEHDSVNTVALYAMSSVLLEQNRYEECIDICNKLIELDDTNADAYYNAGIAYYNQAVALDNSKKYTKQERALMLSFYRKALPYMKTYRSLKPENKRQWVLPLYTIYLNLNMGKEFDEIDSIIKAARAKQTK